MIWDNKIMTQIGIMAFNLFTIEYFVGISIKTINKNKLVNTKGFFVENTKKLINKRRIILKTAMLFLIVLVEGF
jgi:hypothetical protein